MIVSQFSTINRQSCAQRPFDLMKNEIKNIYLIQKKELTVKNYIKELYSKNDIEVNN